MMKNGLDKLMDLIENEQGLREIVIPQYRRLLKEAREWARKMYKRALKAEEEAHRWKEMHDACLCALQNEILAADHLRAKLNETKSNNKTYYGETP